MGLTDHNRPLWADGPCMMQEDCLMTTVRSDWSAVAEYGTAE